MSRDITTAFNTQLTSTSLQPFMAVRMAFQTGDVRLWTGYNEITIDGDIYTGSGTLMSISPAEETSAVEAKGAKIMLSGIPTDMVSIALSQNYQNRKCIIYFGCLSSGAVVADPYPIFTGLMDVMTIDDGAGTVAIGMTVESRLSDLERARDWRYTSENQKSLYPNDKGLDFVVDLQDMPIAWGRSSN